MKRGIIWINGVAFREWIHRTYPKTNLAENETFCLTCKLGVEIHKSLQRNKGRPYVTLSLSAHIAVENLPELPKSIVENKPTFQSVRLLLIPAVNVPIIAFNQKKP
jgi:hypothetical protein